MKQKWISLVLALALLLSVCGITAAAGQEPADPGAASAEGAETAPEAEDPAEDAEPTSPAGPDTPDSDEPPMELPQDEDIRKLAEKTAHAPEPLASISYSEIEGRIRAENLSVLALQETVEMLRGIDYDDLYEDLRKQLNMIADAQWGMLQAASLPEESEFYQPLDSFAYAQTGQLYTAQREQFEAIRDGELQRDNAAAMRQVRDVQDQVIMGGELLYVSLAALERQEASLQRQLAAMNRTVEETELRYQLGQVSALQLSQARAGQSSLASSLSTLQMKLRTCKAQFETLLGAQITGEIRLGGVPEVTEKELAAMDVERDLLAAKAQSYTLYAAAKTLADEQDAYKKAGDSVGYNEEKLTFRTAKYSWQAAQHTYNSALREYELKFRTLYEQVLDYQQILTAARVSLESEKQRFAASELKYQQGTLSQNTYLAAQDDLAAAEDAVQTASDNLFSSYNTYRWAVEHGILN